MVQTTLRKLMDDCNEAKRNARALWREVVNIDPTNGGFEMWMLEYYASNHPKGEEALSELKRYRQLSSQVAGKKRSKK